MPLAVIMGGGVRVSCRAPSPLCLRSRSIVVTTLAVVMGGGVRASCRAPSLLCLPGTSSSHLHILAFEEVRRGASEKDDHQNQHKPGQQQVLSGFGL